MSSAATKKEVTLSELEDDFHQYVTDFKTQLCKTHVGLPEDFVSGFVTNDSAEWKSFYDEHRNDAKELDIIHNKKLQKLQENKDILANLPKEKLNHFLDKVSEIRSNVQYENESVSITVKHPVIVLSKILPTLEVTLKENKTVKNVHFEAKYVLYIDKSFEKNTWHGTSVKIVAERVECVATNLHFDVSGNNGVLAILKANNARIPGQNGYQGADGASGENGGSIEILSNTYCGMKKLSIYTNGGNGTNGQDGGDGCDGTNGNDGKFISIDELKMHFQSPMGRISFQEDKIKTAIRYLRTRSQSLVPFCKGFNEKGCMTDYDMFSEKYIYYKGVLDINVHYEYCYSKWSTGSSFYAFFMGENGTNGSLGGKGGYGGKAGKKGNAGSIFIALLSDGTEYTKDMPIKFQKAGRDGSTGSPGKSGKNGHAGCNGQDAAIMDFSRWIWPRCYSDQRYSLVNEDNKNSDNVWCCKTGKYRQVIQDSGLVSRNIETI